MGRTQCRPRHPDYSPNRNRHGCFFLNRPPCVGMQGHRRYAPNPSSSLALLSRRIVAYAFCVGRLAAVSATGNLEDATGRIDALEMRSNSPLHHLSWTVAGTIACLLVRDGRGATVSAWSQTLDIGWSRRGETLQSTFDPAIASAQIAASHGAVFWSLGSIRLRQARYCPRVKTRPPCSPQPECEQDRQS
jgi:hypothetical protein